MFGAVALGHRSSQEGVEGKKGETLTMHSLHLSPNLVTWLWQLTLPCWAKVAWLAL